MNTKENDRGVSSVEFALLLPLLMLILFMVIEFSLVLYDKAVVTNASREGARAGVVHGGPKVPIEDVVSYYCASNLISFSTATPSTSIVGACVNPGDALEVDVKYTYTFLWVPKWLTTAPGTIDLTGITTMRCE